MKRVLLVLACFCFSAVSISAQTSRSTRPRIVPENPTTAQPPTIKNDSPKTQDKKTPPTLTRDYRDLPPPPPLPQEPIEDDEEIVINTNLVTFPVSVLDRNGRFISGLQQKDFKIFENGVEQKIEIFNSVEQPFTVVLLLDMSNSTQFQINEIQDAAITFVNQLRRDDKVMVVSFDERVHVLSRPTNNRAVLRDAILRTDFGGGTSLYDAVHTVINQHLRNIEGRKAIVLFTDGVDTTSYSIGPNQTLRDIEELDVLVFPIRYDTFADVQRMKNQPVIIPPTRPSPIPTSTPNPLPFPIPTGGVGTPGGQGTSIEDYRRAEQYLNDLANRTGGRVYEASTTGYLRRAFSSIASELREFYSIGYYLPEGAAEGERRRIKVKVDRENVSVAARDHYTVGKKAKKKGAR